MGDWSFLASLLDKVQSHSTAIGKVWLTVLFVFRLLVLVAGIDKVWGDEQSRMECNMKSPGCRNHCYDVAFPISLMRFWVLQIIFVSIPTLIYLAHVMHVIHKENKLRRKQVKGKNGIIKLPKYTDEKGKVHMKGNLLASYMCNIFFKIIFETGFIVGQFYLFGLLLPRKINCFGDPCPGIHVECFISRPTEKNIFHIFMQVMAFVSLVLNVVEMFYLIGTKARQRHNRPSAVEMFALDGKNQQSHKETFC
ncbi:gap junction Cx32.2 protein [Esox lucius]|uniref:Connexin 28.1 n=1 Tax=Esox lucius TaxID=8010 RepID=A0AAY5KC95_ESOLU|nr:gap junction Cx32.2 protein [Esox lucius]